MAQQDNSVLGTEVTESKGFLEQVSDFGSEVAEQAGEAFDTAVDIGGELIEQVGDYIEPGIEAIGEVTEDVVDYVKESPVGQFFDGNDPIELEKSEVISEEMLEQVRSLDKDSLFDYISDIWDSLTTVYDKYTDDNIQDMEAFNAIQELRKNYYDELARIEQNIRELKQIPGYEVSELNRLETLKSQVIQAFEESEQHLVVKAIKGPDYATKKAMLENINKGLASSGKISSQAELMSLKSKETDDFIRELSRENSGLKGIVDPLYISSITSLKTRLSEELTGIKVNQIKTINSLREAGVSQAEIEKRVLEYNDYISLTEDMIEKTLEAAYAGITSENMAEVVAHGMGEADVRKLVRYTEGKTLEGIGEEAMNKLLEYDNNLMTDISLQAGIGNLKQGDLLVGGIQALGGVFSTGITFLKDTKNVLTKATTQEEFERDNTVLSEFDKTGLDKWVTWTLLNADDLILNVGGMVLGGAVPKIAGKVTGVSSYTAQAAAKLQTIMKQNKVARYLLSSGKLSPVGLADNVATGVIPNVIINNAVGDVTSEGRILFDSVMDLAIGPVLDITLKGGARVFTKAFQGFGGVADDILIKNISKTFNLKDKDAAELLDTIKMWRDVTGKDLTGDAAKKKFTTDILDDLQKSEGKAIDKDGVIARFREDIEQFHKRDSGLDKIVNHNIKTKDIDLLGNTLEARQVERLFKQIDTTNTKKKESFLNDILLGLGVAKKDLKLNKAEIVEVGNELYDIAVGAKEAIKDVRNVGVLTKDNEKLINDLGRFNKLVDKVALKFNKKQQYVDLYLKNGDKVTMNVSDIKTKGIRMESKDGTKLFTTNSVMDRMDKREGIFEGHSETVMNFIRYKGGLKGVELNKEDIENITDLLMQMTGHKLVNLSEEGISVADFDGLLGLYKTDLSTYKLTVGGKYTRNLEFSEKEIDIELSGSEYAKASKTSKKASAAEAKYKEAVKDLKEAEVGKGKLTISEAKKAVKAAKANKISNKKLEKVKLTREEIQEGTINRTIWNRVLLSNKTYTAEQFDDIMASEGINIAKLISTTNNVLRNALTLKDVSEVKSYVINKLTKQLSPALESAEHKQFFELLEQTVFSEGGLNLLSRFSRGLNAKGDKVSTLANLMESMALHSAVRFKRLDLRTNILQKLEQITDTRQSKQVVSDLLLGYDPIDATKMIEFKGKNLKKGHALSKNIIKQIEDATGIKVNDPMLKHTDKDIEDFIEGVVVSQLEKGNIDLDGVPGLKTRTTQKIVARVNAAKDAYMGGIMKQVYQGDDSINSLLHALEEEGLVKAKLMDEGQLEASRMFEIRIEKAMKNSKNLTTDKVYKEVEGILSEYKGAKLTEGIYNNIKTNLDKLNLQLIPADNIKLASLIEDYNKIKDVIVKVADKFKKEGDYKTFDFEAFQIGDNIVVKSLNHIINPDTGALVFEDGIAKELSTLIDKHLLDGNTEEGFFEISKKLRDENISTNWREIYNDKLKELQTKVDLFLNPRDIEGATGELSEAKIKLVGKALKDRNNKLKELYNDIKTFVSKETESYKVYDKKGKLKTQAEVTSELFSGRAKFGSYKSLLKTFQNRIKLEPFDGYKLNIGNGKFQIFSGLEEKRTLFTNIKQNISNDGIYYEPIIIDGGSKLYNFIGESRETHVRINNLYKWLHDNSEAKGTKEYKKIHKEFSKAVTPKLEKLGLGVTNNFIDNAANKLGLSPDVYLLSLNIGDKDGIGIGFHLDPVAQEGKNFEELMTMVSNNFSKEFKDFYQFEGKDRAADKIGKRISTLSHEDTSMTPGLKMEITDIMVEELPVTKIFLRENRGDGLEVFTLDEEKVIKDILAKDKITLEDKKVIVGLFENNEVINDQTLINFKGADKDATILAKWDYLDTAVTDGASYTSPSIAKLISYYQGYVKKGDPIKYHEANLGKDLNKTLWSPFTKNMGKQLKEQGFNPESAQLVGIESKKIGKGTYKKIEEDKFIVDEQGVKRRILGYRKSNIEFLRPASEEVYEEGKDITGVTKQVTAQGHAVSKKLVSIFEEESIEQTYKNIKDTLALNEELPIGTMSDYGKFLSDLQNKLELENLSDTKRSYIQAQFKKLLSYFEKPKEDGLGYRGAFVPRASYVDKDGLPIPTKTDEVYVSPTRFKQITVGSKTDGIEPSGTLKIGDNYYVMAYRSPVANPENVTLQKIVVDYSMESTDVIGLSPINVNILKQADHDGDHLNIVYIKPGVHAGGVASALSFVLKNETGLIQEESIMKIMKDIYDPALDYQTKETLALELITKFITDNGDKQIPMPVVAVDQIEEASEELIVDASMNLKEVAKDIWNDNVVKVDGVDTLDYKGLKYTSTSTKKGKELKAARIETELAKQAPGDKKNLGPADMDTYVSRFYNSKAKIIADIEDRLKTKLRISEEGKALFEANTKAIVGKDNISLVAASTRTYSGLRDIAYEWKHRDIIGLEEKDLARLLSLKTSDPEFVELKGIFENMDLSLKTYASESASINQKTVDAAKKGTLPPQWEEKLEMAALDRTEPVTEKLQKHITKLSTTFNKVYDATDFMHYGRKHKSKEGFVIDDKAWGAMTPFGNNVGLRDRIRDISIEFDDEILKGVFSYEKYIEEILGLPYLKNKELVDALHKMLPEEDKWLADVIIFGNSPYSLRKIKLHTKTGKTKAGHDYIKGTPNLDWSKGYPKFKYEKGEVVSKIDTKVLEDMGFTIEKGDIYYKQKDFYSFINEKGYKEYKPNFNKNKEYSAIGTGLQIVSPKGKQLDKLMELLISKLNQNQVSYGVTDLFEDIVYTKEDLIKLIHSNKGSKYHDEYINWIMSQHIFPADVLSQSSKADMQNMATVKMKTFLQDNINSPKVEEEIKKKFGDILNSMGDFGEIRELKLSDGNLVVKTSGTNMKDIKVQAEEQLFDIRVVDDTIYVKEESELNNISKKVEVLGNTNILQEFKKSPLHAEADMFEELGMYTKDIRDLEYKMDRHLQDIYSVASLTNSKLAGKYFKKELERNEFISFGLPEGTYDRFTEIKRKYGAIDNNITTEIDNAIYYKRNDSSVKQFEKYADDALVIDYIKTVKDFYNKYLAKHVNNKKINIKAGYKAGSLIEDIVGLEIGRTEKIAFLEQGIFDIADFDKLAQKRMGDNYKGSLFKDFKDKETKEGTTIYSNRINDLFGGIFEKNVLDESTWLKGLRNVRNMAYNIIYGSLSWFTHLGGLLVGTSQIPVEMLRIQSMTSHIKGLTDNVKMNDLVNKYGILHNVGIETAIRVGPQEINAPIAQKGLFRVLDSVGAIFGANKNAKYQEMSRRIAALGGNPMIITDLVLDSARKRGAIADTIYMLGFDSVDAFTRYLDSVPLATKESLLSKVRLSSKNMYHDMTGGVTAGSYLYRESYLSRRGYMIPFNFLMGWGNRLAGSALEDAALFGKGALELAKGNTQRGFDLMFKQSKAIDKFVTNTIMAVGLYGKINSHDNYNGEFNKRKSITEWVMGMNANFIAIGMSFPYKLAKAGIEGDEGMTVRAANVLNQAMVDMFRELDIGELLVDNIEDYLKGDRETIEDAILEAINTRAAKGLMYNKIIAAESLYSEFRERDDISNMLSLGIESEEEKRYHDMYQKLNDGFLQLLVDNNLHGIVILEAIKSAPFLSLLLKNADFGSYQVYVREYKPFIKYLASKDFNKSFLDMDVAMEIIEDGELVNNLYKSLQTSINAYDGLDLQGKAILKSSIANLNEDLIANRLKEKYGASYANMIAGREDGGLEYIIAGAESKQRVTNQLMIKLASDFPSSTPYILGQLLKSEYSEYQKTFDDRDSITNLERDTFQKEVLKKYEPLIRASALTENQLATFLAVSAKPEFLQSVLNSNGYIKDTVSDRVAMQLAISQSFNRGETNPGYLLSRFASVTNKITRGAEDTKDRKAYYTEDQMKGKLLDIYNYSLDQINNSTLSVDQQVEIKSALLKSLGKHGYILEKDPILNKGFEGARVNLSHKLFDTTVNLKKYAEDAKIALAVSKGIINKGTGKAMAGRVAYRNKGGSKPYPGSLGDIPKLRNILNNPKNGFKKIFTPGKTGFIKSSQIRPLNISSNKRQIAIEQFRKMLLSQKSNPLIKATKKYEAPPKYLRVGKAETIKVALENSLKPIYKKRTKGLLKGLPYNRK